MDDLHGISLPNQLLNELTEVGVLLFEEYPSTVLFSKGNSYYIQEWVDCSDDGTTDRFFLYKTNEKFIYKFLRNEISHSDLVLNSIEGYVFFYDYDKDTETISDFTLVSINNIPRDYIPSSNQLNIAEEIIKKENK